MKAGNRKILIWGIVLLLVWYYSKIANAAMNLGFSKGRMYDFKFSLKEGYVTWIQGINVINGDFVGIPIRSAGVMVSSGGAQIGYAVLEGPSFIEPSTISELKLRVIIPLQNLLGLASSLVNQIKAGKVNASFAGTINSIGVTYPLNQSYNLDFSKDGTV